MQALALSPNQRRPLLLIPREMAPNANRERAQSMHNHAPKHDKADDRPDQHNRPLRVDGKAFRRGMRQGGRGIGLELGAGLDGEEQRADANGAEVAAEKGLGGGADVGEEVEFEEGEDDGDATEEEDEEEDCNEPAGCDGVEFVERGPGDHGAEEDEERAVE